MFLRLIYTVIAAAVLLVLLVLFYASSIITTAVETIGTEAVGAPVKVGSVDIGFLSGEGSIKRLTVGNPEGFSEDNAFELGEIYLKMDPLSLFTPKIHVQEVRVKEPMIYFEGSLKGSNFQAIQKNVQAYANSGGQPSKLMSKTEEEKIDAAIAQENKAESAKKIQLDYFVMEEAKADVSLNVMNKLHNASINLPKLEVRGIGQEGEGASAADVVNKVVQPVLSSVVKESTKVASDVQNQLNKVKDQARERFQKEKEGFMNKLLGK